MGASAERIAKGKCLPTIDEEGEDLSSDDDVNGETVAKGEDSSSDDEGMSSDDVVTTTSDLMARAAGGRLMFDDGRGEVPPNHVVLAWSTHMPGTVRVAEPLALLRYAGEYTRTQHPRLIVHRANWGPYYQRRVGDP